MAVRLQRQDILFAHLALNIAQGLSGTTRQVGAAIVDHFNKKTGRCDPSLERIATLLGLSKTTVHEATAALDREALIKKESHGGRHHSASYIPNWDKFRAIVADWNIRMRVLAPPPKRESPRFAKRRSLSSPNGESDVRQTAKQTFRKNLPKEPGVVDGSDSKSGMKSWKGVASPLTQYDVVHALERTKRDSSRSAAAQAAADRKLARGINSIANPKLREAAWLREMGETIVVSEEVELSGTSRRCARKVAGPSGSKTVCGRAKPDKSPA